MIRLFLSVSSVWTASAGAARDRSSAAVAAASSRGAARRPGQGRLVPLAESRLGRGFGPAAAQQLLHRWILSAVTVVEHLPQPIVVDDLPRHQARAELLLAQAPAVIELPQRAVALELELEQCELVATGSTAILEQLVADAGVSRLLAKLLKRPHRIVEHLDSADVRSWRERRIDQTVIARREAGGGTRSVGDLRQTGRSTPATIFIPRGWTKSMGCSGGHSDLSPGRLPDHDRWIEVQGTTPMASVALSGTVKETEGVRSAHASTATGTLLRQGLFDVHRRLQVAGSLDRSSMTSRRDT